MSVSKEELKALRELAEDANGHLQLSQLEVLDMLDCLIDKDKRIAELEATLPRWDRQFKILETERDTLKARVEELERLDRHWVSHHKFVEVEQERDELRNKLNNSVPQSMDLIHARAVANNMHERLEKVVKERDELKQLEAENAKLRTELADNWATGQGVFEELKAENAELHRLLQGHTDAANATIARSIMAENAKLRAYYQDVSERLGRVLLKRRQTTRRGERQ